jgi:hypothetical protein
MSEVKPDHMIEADWQDWLENGLGPCGNCGERAVMGFSDLIETTKPESRVVTFDIVHAFRMCAEHTRPGMHIYKDGTIEHG